MRVVIDANVLVSFLLTSGPTISNILHAWKKKKFKLLITDEILLEIRQILERFIVGDLVDTQVAQALYKRLKDEATVIPSMSYINVSSDKKDNRYLACAKDGKADYLVTGDKKHLLKLKVFEKTRIVSPKEFVEVLEKK